MKLRRQLSILLPAMLLALFVGAANAASGNGIHDDGKFFSDGAIAQATKIIDQIDQKHQKDLLVETIPSVPDDQQAQLQAEGKETFFKSFATNRAKSAGVNGVYILVCKDPSYLYTEAGKNTRQRAFTADDVSALRTKLVSAFKQKQFDQGLIDGAAFVQQQMDAHGTGAGSSGSHAATPAPSGTGNRFPAIPSPRANQNWGIGGIACVLIAIVFGIIALRGIFSRSRGGGYYPQQGGYYPPQQGGGYPMQGGGGYYPQQGGGGSGFGRGFLGGLLGGAVGGYAADRFMHGGQQSSGYTPPAGGDAGSGGSFGDTPSGPDFGSGGEAGSGGDFGGGGGSDFGGGGGGGDSGGGGGSGGDF